MGNNRLFAVIGAVVAALLAGGAVLAVAAIAGVGPFSDDGDDDPVVEDVTDEDSDEDGSPTEDEDGEPKDPDDGDVPEGDAPIQRIIIDGAEIDNSSILTLSLQDDLRTFEVPTNATQVAWYDFSGLPGEENKHPILAAHVDYQGQKGPFYTLTEAAPGTFVYLVMGDGTIYQYEVDTNRDIAKASLTWEDVGCDFNQCYAPEAITLITCGGNFNPRTRSYTDNVVVRASLVGEVEESELPA